MRVVVQRVESAGVEHEGSEVARISGGLILYVGIVRGETPGADAWLVEELRRVAKPGDEILCLSQFTLLASFKGPKPSFNRAEAHAVADAYFTLAFERLCEAFPGRVRRGPFGKVLAINLSGAQMVTFLLERQCAFPSK